MSTLLVDIIHPETNPNRVVRVRCHDCYTINHVHVWAIMKRDPETGAHSFNCIACHAWQYSLPASAMDEADLLIIS